MVLEKIMNDLFIKSFDANDRDQLIHILKSYILLNKQQSAEQVFQETYTKPFMLMFLNDSYMERNDSKLAGVYAQIIGFINNHADFLRLTNEIKCG